MAVTIRRRHSNNIRNRLLCIPFPSLLTISVVALTFLFLLLDMDADSSAGGVEAAKRKKTSSSGGNNRDKKGQLGPAREGAWDKVEDLESKKQEQQRQGDAEKKREEEEEQEKQRRRQMEQQQHKHRSHRAVSDGGGEHGQQQQQQEVHVPPEMREQVAKELLARGMEQSLGSSGIGPRAPPKLPMPLPETRWSDVAQAMEKEADAGKKPHPVGMEGSGAGGGGRRDEV